MKVPPNPFWLNLAEADASLEWPLSTLFFFFFYYYFSLCLSHTRPGRSLVALLTLELTFD